MHANLRQSCLTLCHPVNHSLPGSSVHGILQERRLEWVAVPSSRRSSWPRDKTYISQSPALTGRLSTTRVTWEAYYRFQVFTLIYDIYFSLTSITLYDSLQVHPCLCKWQNCTDEAICRAEIETQMNRTNVFLLCRRHRFDPWFG